MTKTVLPIEAKVNGQVAAEVEKLKGFKPKWRFVLIQIEKAETSSGGILLPEQRKERPVIGTVIEVGPQAEQVKVGERVLFGRFAGVEVEMPTGERLTSHRILRDEECYGGWGK